MELIEAEYGEGGHKAIYNIPEDGELVDGKVPRFQPEFFDIRYAYHAPMTSRRARGWRGGGEDR